MRKNKLFIPAILSILLVVFFLQKKHQVNIDEKGITYRESESYFKRDTSLLSYSKHARCRMDCRRIDEFEIKEILQKGRINHSKSEPDGSPDPKYALEGITRDRQRVRVVFAVAK